LPVAVRKRNRHRRHRQLLPHRRLRLPAAWLPLRGLEKRLLRLRALRGQKRRWKKRKPKEQKRSKAVLGLIKFATEKGKVKPSPFCI
jgi:hypothetical protein